MLLKRQRQASLWVAPSVDAITFSSFSIVACQFRRSDFQCRDNISSGWATETISRGIAAGNWTVDIVPTVTGHHGSYHTTMSSSTSWVNFLIDIIFGILNFLKRGVWRLVLFSFLALVLKSRSESWQISSFYHVWIWETGQAGREKRWQWWPGG